jgi:circadian clock protein KaiC
MSEPTGAAALDAILGGGFPKGRTTIVTGGAGCGKTILGMQFLATGAIEAGETGLMITFEESPEKLVQNFSTMTFPIVKLLGGPVQLLDGRPPDDVMVSGDFDLKALISVADSLVRKHNVKRVVIDAIDALFAFSTDRALVQRETLRLLQWLDQSGITSIITLKATGEGLPELFAFADFAADGVLQLRSTMHGQLLQRTVRVLKLRGRSVDSGEHPYTLSRAGLRALYSAQRTIIAETNTSAERCSTGVGPLDDMMSGGYLRGSTTLFSGLPGASKTTFGAAFLAAGCRAGERALFVGFDEPAEQMMQNVRSVGIDLRSHRESGFLRLESFSASTAIADDFYLKIEQLIDEHNPSIIVVDPVSALDKSGGTDVSEATVERLVLLFKSRGLTAIFTAVSESNTTMMESTAVRISTVADTWIHLSFASEDGERNRTLSVVKSRGTAHSAQMREIVLSATGITFAPMFAGDGPVLFGTKRLHEEQRLRAKRVDDRRHAQHDIRLLDEQLAVMEARQNELARQLQELTDRRTEVATNFATAAQESEADSAALHVHRSAHPGAE